MKEVQDLTAANTARPAELWAILEAAKRSGRLIEAGSGLVFQSEWSRIDWRLLLRALLADQRRKSFDLGDALNYGESMWGDKYAWALEETSLQESTLRDYAWVCRSVDLSIRIDKLSFAHHQLVAPLNADEQTIWLGKALTNGWSVADLRGAIRASKRTETDQPAMPPSLWIPTSWVNEGVRKLKRMEPSDALRMELRPVVKLIREKFPELLAES